MKKKPPYPPTLFWLCLLVALVATGCSTTRSKKIPESSGSSPTSQTGQPFVDWESLLENNPSSSVRAFLHTSRQVGKEVGQEKIPYSVEGIAKNWNRSYLRSADKYDFMRENGVDCTRFLWHLFYGEMRLPYNSQYPAEAIISNVFARSKTNKQLEHFVPLKRKQGGFQPRPGDILAFPGHALSVVDPKNCIAVQSASWMCEKMNAQGNCLQSAKGKSAGVALYKLKNKNFCHNGIWKNLDTKRHRFTGGWRHRALDTWIEEMPEKAHAGQIITLTGVHIAHRLIYFSGVHNPVRTSAPIKKRTHKNGEIIETVKIKVPKHAKSGKLKIHWGRSHGGNPAETVETLNTLQIVTKKEEGQF